jgi:Flp pilus assembly pilin Flp
MRKKKGQSILEYVIVLTAIVAAIIFAAVNYIQPAVKKGLENVGTSINKSTGQLPGATNSSTP